MDCVRDCSATSCCSHMMTKLKLNVYRAEDEFIIMQRLQWRKEEEESKKERRKVGWEVEGRKKGGNFRWRKRWLS